MKDRAFVFYFVFYCGCLFAIAIVTYSHLTRHEVITGKNLRFETSSEEHFTIDAESVVIEGGSPMPFILKNVETLQVISSTPGVRQIGNPAKDVHVLSPVEVSGGMWVFESGGNYVELRVVDSSSTTITIESTRITKGLAYIATIISVFFVGGVLFIIMGTFLVEY